MGYKKEIKPRSNFANLLRILGILIRMMIFAAVIPLVVMVLGFAFPVSFFLAEAITDEIFSGHLSPSNYLYRFFPILIPIITVLSILAVINLFMKFTTTKFGKKIGNWLFEF